MNRPEEAVRVRRCEHGDARVHPFPGGMFDVAMSRFGVMFFAGWGPIRHNYRIGRPTA